MRLIDADRLKEAFREDSFNTMGTIDTSTVELIEIEIGEMPTAYEWIPVSKKLPNENPIIHVYVTAKSKEGGGRFVAPMIWEYNRFIWENGKDVADKWEILAWMPRNYPEPYKEVEE